MSSAPRTGNRRMVAAAFAVAVTAAGAAALTITATPSTAASCTGYVALTFDDGPGATTAVLLDALKAAGVRATLFNIGQNAQQNPDLVKAEVAAGMWIGNHSWTHPHLPAMTTDEIRSEISRTQQVLQDLTGTAPRLFRPPYLDTNDTLRSVEAEFGLTEINTDIDSRDWDNASPDQIVANAGALKAGDVILMHDWPANTVTALPRVVAGLAERGLCAGMISPTTGRAVAPDSVPTPSGPATAVGPSASTVPPAAGRPQR